MFKKFKNWCFEDKKVFAEGLSFDKLYIIYLFGCVFGVYFEQIRNLIIHYMNDGTIFWEYRRGVIYGPFNPLYGVGAVLLTYFLLRKPLSNFKTFLYASLIGGGLEYIISFLQETFIGTTSWNYSNYFLNINGRTNIPYMLFWGLLGIILIKVIYPFISKYVEKIPYNIGILFINCMHVFMFFNCFISWGALIRQGLRVKGKPAYTFFGNFFDKYYPDAFLRERFSNMKFVR